jgi:hypothetical protein
MVDSQNFGEGYHGCGAGAAGFPVARTDYSVVKSAAPGARPGSPRSTFRLTGRSMIRVHDYYPRREHWDRHGAELGNAWVLRKGDEVARGMLVSHERAGNCDSSARVLFVLYARLSSTGRTRWFDRSQTTSEDGCSPHRSFC